MPEAMDPTNVAVKVHLRKEFFVVSEIATELTRRGLGELVAKMMTTAQQARVGGAWTCSSTSKASDCGL